MVRWFGFFGHGCDSFPGSFPLPSHRRQFPEGTAGILPRCRHEPHLPDRSRQRSHHSRPKLSAEELEPETPPRSRISSLTVPAVHTEHKAQLRSPALVLDLDLVPLWTAEALLSFYFFVLKQRHEVEMFISVFVYLYVCRNCVLYPF